MFPDDPNVVRYENDKSELWAVVNDKRFRVADAVGGGPLFIYAEGQKTLSLSPNGIFAISALPVKAIPAAWDRLYRPAASSYPRRLSAGPQVLTASSGLFYISVYVLVDLQTGETTPLTSTPAGNAVGWWNSDSQAEWADDGQFVILPNTFVPPASASETGAQRPCIVVMNLNSRAFSCVEQFKAPTSEGFEDGWRSVQSVHFIGRDAMHIVVSYRLLRGSRRSVVYWLANGGWLPTNDQSDNDGRESRGGIAVFVRQSLNDPPVLIVADPSKRVSRVLLDPNPQLRGISLGESSIVSFTGTDQLKWFAGLYKPPTFRGGQRYPLVIQTHGFVEDRFDPSGVFPTAYAARALAAEGILVLQVPECPNYGTPGEASCNALRYKTAVEELVAQGLADPHRVGIVGFSRTCFHVLYALTVYPTLFAAASITDGINEGYLQYLASVDQMDNLLAKDYDAMIGARPFGDGLILWLAKSPPFNMDKVQTVLQVVANGRRGLLEMWEPYASLRYLNKPVDFVMLQEGTHVLTNPRQRLASQGGTVDWFRFWLQGEASSEPTKRSQYTRWRQLSRLGNTLDGQGPLKATP
jgi:dipeptidyl aminopeptidase/acylaminoacyl peptidase